jgi:hypothetical protein
MAPERTAVAQQPGATEVATAAPTGSVVSAPTFTRPKPRAARPAKGSEKSERKNRADVVLPGFETLADGSTRLFVELSKPVAYETKVAGGKLTCVLKGAHVDRRNNYNPLVTVHFNTPVTSARLVPRGADLWLVAEMRAKVQPSVTMETTPDGRAVLRLEFPKGEYIPGGGTSGEAAGASRSSDGAAIGGDRAADTPPASGRPGGEPARPPPNSTSASSTPASGR